MSIVYQKNEGTVAVNTTTVNVAANADGQTIALPAGLLVNTGDYVDILTTGVCNTITATINLFFGATAVVTQAFTGAGVPFTLTASVIRTGAATQIASGMFVLQGE